MSSQPDRYFDQLAKDLTALELPALIAVDGISRRGTENHSLSALPTAVFPLAANPDTTRRMRSLTPGIVSERIAWT